MAEKNPVRSGVRGFFIAIIKRVSYNSSHEKQGAFKMYHGFFRVLRD